MARGYVRRKYFIDKKFQGKFIIRFCFLIIFTTLLMTLFMILFTQDSTTVAIENTKVVVKTTSDFIFPVMVQTFFTVVFASAISVSALILIITHRIAGPAYRLTREAECLREGNLDMTFNIRSRDELKPLASALSELAKDLRRRKQERQEKLAALKQALERDDLRARVEEIEKI